MATIIQIKRSQSTETPTGLANGELAYSYAGNKLFIGQTDTSGSAVTNEVIGGGYYVNLLDHAHGTLVANSALIADGNQHINNIKVSNLQIMVAGGSANGIIGVQNDSSMGAANNSTLATSKSIKNYVDNQLTAQDLDLNADDNRTTSVDLDSQTFTVAGGTGIDTNLATAQTVTVVLSNTAVTAGTYGTSTGIPQISIDQQGRITSATTQAISTTLDIAADSGTDDGVRLGTDTLTISGTSNEIETSVSGDTVTIGLPDDVTIGGELNVSENATISGNLVVSGTLSYLNTTNLAIQDPLIKLANNNTADAVDIGFFGKYSTTKSAGLFRDANDSGKFKLFHELAVDPTTTVNTSGSGYAAATLVLGSLELGTDLAVTHGGTGAGSFTSNGILYGNGTGALQVTAAGTEGKVLQAGSGGTPEFGDLDGGSF